MLKTLCFEIHTTHQDAFVHVAVVVAQVHAYPDDAGVSHLTVVHGQRGHGRRALVVRGGGGGGGGGRGGARAGSIGGVWGGGGGAGGGRCREGRGGAEGFGHIVARAVEALQRRRGGRGREEVRQRETTPHPPPNASFTSRKKRRINKSL